MKTNRLLELAKIYSCKSKEVVKEKTPALLVVAAILAIQGVASTNKGGWWSSET